MMIARPWERFDTLTVKVRRLKSCSPFTHTNGPSDQSFSSIIGLGEILVLSMRIYKTQHGVWS